MKKLIYSLFLIVSLILISGCRVYEMTEDDRHIKITAFLTDTKIGKLEAATPEGGKLSVDNYDSSQQALQAINKILDKMPPIP